MVPATLPTTTCLKNPPLTPPSPGGEGTIADTHQDKHEQPFATDAAYQLALRTAVVAGVFCLLVGTLLFYDYSRRQLKDPLEDTTIQALKAAAAQQPANDALKEQIRTLDLELRAEYFRQRAFAATGGLLLLGGIALFLRCRQVGRHAAAEVAHAAAAGPGHRQAVAVDAHCPLGRRRAGRGAAGDCRRPDRQLPQSSAGTGRHGRLVRPTRHFCD